MAVKKKKIARKNQKAKAKAKLSNNISETLLTSNDENQDAVEDVSETEETGVSSQAEDARQDVEQPETKSTQATSSQQGGDGRSNDDDQEDDEEDGMSFWDHLEVLRWALFRTACVMLVAFCLWFWAMPHIFDSFVMGATSSDFFVYKWLTKLSHGLISFDPNFNVEIINIEVTGPFMIHIKTSFYMAAIVTFPYIIYELWRFIRPALFENEIRHLRPAFLGGTLMFFIGFIAVLVVGGMKLYALSHGVQAMLVGVNPYFHIAILMMILGCMLFLAGFLAELVIRNSPSRNDYLIKEEI